MKLPSKEDLREKLLPVLTRFRIPLLFLALGLVLLLLPSGKKAAAEPSAAEPSDTQYLQKTQQELKSLLQTIRGVGRAEVMLTLQSGAESVFQTDSRTVDADTSRTKEQTTVYASGSGSQRSPAVVRTDYPVFLGAVVVCQGADSASVRLAVMQAVSSLTGLGSDKITVIKMKE